ncbi:hypothetical protein QCN29_32495 [Streptomyces sp. HNM0663]|uniref:SprT-like domain-containing protein n=1 Tax=Streptomyces chengmaiensis TaxID=3040919 RepID=A0ABT6HXH1_9ACTN|nr:hypothetical protein [Streptomyces chengmaiensis]MDH2393403.1 hypothetical protein [Streptomyces chengmaiensis]
MLTVTSDSVSYFQRRLVKHTESIAPDAARLVAGRFGALPPVQLVMVGDLNRWSALTADTELALIPGVSDRIQAAHRREYRRGRRSRYGITVLGPNGVIIPINLRKARTETDINATVVHELTHAHQLGNTQARAQHIAYLRHCWDVEKLPRRQVKQYERLIDRREVEAHGAETLASRLPA